MLKILVLGFLICIGLAVAFAIYAAYRITRMGQALRRGPAPTDDPFAHNGYITTTGTTLHDSETGRAIESTQPTGGPDDSPGSSVGESIGSAIGESVTDFSSSDFGDSGSSGGDSGGGDSGGGSSD